RPWKVGGWFSFRYHVVLNRTTGIWRGFTEFTASVRMLDLLRNLQQAIQAGQSVAYTALVETRGSTPQKAGAGMLVFPDGSQFGTLGGGCVEAEVKRRALRLLDQGETELLTFQLDDNYGWDDGLICGGRMKMLVDPIRGGEDVSYYRKWAELVLA